MSPVQRRFTDLLMTKRLQTLQSIDNGIEKVRDCGTSNYVLSKIQKPDFACLYKFGKV